jgi:hypothetical protein
MAARMKLAPPVAPMLRRYRSLQLGWCLPFLAISSLFWAGAHFSDEPMMPAEVYGEWVVSSPAEWWALSIMAGCASWLVGILINGDWRWSPFLRLIGTTWQVCTLGAFAIGSIGTQFGEIVSTGGAVFAVAHIFAVRWAIVDCAFVVREGALWKPS